MRDPGNEVVLIVSLFTHAKDKASAARGKNAGMRWALRAKRAISKVVFSFALASSSLAILSSCLKIEYLKIRKVEVCEQSRFTYLLLAKQDLHKMSRALFNDFNFVVCSKVKPFWGLHGSEFNASVTLT